MSIYGWGLRERGFLLNISIFYRILVRKCMMFSCLDVCTLSLPLQVMVLVLWLMSVYHHYRSWFLCSDWCLYTTITGHGSCDWCLYTIITGHGTCDWCLYTIITGHGSCIPSLQVMVLVLWLMSVYHHYRSWYLCSDWCLYTIFTGHGSCIPSLQVMVLVLWLMHVHYQYW